MASEEAVAKRANLVASRVQWSHMNPSESSQHQETQALVKRNTSCDDDLALGVEDCFLVQITRLFSLTASIYGNQGVRTVQDFLRWTRSSPAVSRWNSFNSTPSDQSGPLSVMDVLNLWNEDPEEVLFDLGFGCDEPDLSGRIPARFINYQSQARGINLQVFLEAQKNRLDLENPDVSNRFRQLEVLQQVTTAFSSLLGSSSSLRASQEKDLPPEVRERRRRMGMLFRKASKKTLSHIKNKKKQDLTTSHATSPLAAPESHYPPSSLADNRIPLKRVKTGFLETMCLSPLAEEQGTGPDAQSNPQVASLIAQDGALRSWSLREGRSLTGNPFLQRKKSPGQVRESFEMEEIHSFDESSITGSFTGGAEHLVRCVVRTNSCQSDSSGFLEEPFIPSQSQQESPAPDLIKALSCLSGGSTDSSSERPHTPSPSSPSSPHSSPTSLLPSSLASFSPCLSPEQSLIFGPSPSPALLCDPKYDLDNSDTMTLTDQAQCPPVSLAASEYEYLSPCFSSPELQDINDQSETRAPASFTLVSSRSSPMKADSMISISEEIKMEDKDSPSPSLSVLSCDSDPTACSTFSSVTPPVSSTYSPNLDFLFNSINSSSGGPGDTQSKQTGEYFHQNSLSATDGLSSQLPSDPFLTSSAPSEFYCASSEALSSQSLENNESDSLLRDSGEKGPCDPPRGTQTKAEEAPSCHISQLDQDRPLDPPDLILDSSRFGEFNQQPNLTPNPSVTICESTLSSKSHFKDSLIDPTIGGISDFTEQSIYQQEGKYCFDDVGDIAVACPAQDVIPAKMDYLSLDLEDTLLWNEREERGDDRHSDTVQTPETVVYISHTESFAGLSEGSRLVDKEEEEDPQVLSGSLHGELSTETKPEEDINGTESESLTTSLRFHEEVPETHTRNGIQPKSLFEIDSLDVAFQTSVDGSESENGDLDAYFQQLDNERQVYWAEPIQISNQSSLLEESGSFEASDGSPGNSLLTRGAAILDSLLSTGKVMSSLMSSSTIYTAPANPDTKSLSRSVSVQMSSSPSSHIIRRKDVPYSTDSKRSTLLPTVVPLDTSTPFRAVQSWTDWQIQKNNLSKMFSHGAPDTVQNEAIVSTGVSETIQRPTLIFSSSPSLPLLSYDRQSYDCFPEMGRENSTVSVSLDKGLWSDEEEEVERNGNEDEKNLWEGNHTATMACCFSCDHQVSCNNNKQHTLGNIPYSLDELEEMMLCLQQFRSVLCNMEEQLSEDQASVYSALSDQDREKVKDIEELRQAVKKEAGELEMHLNELAHHYDDSLKMKMHRLLDEQSLLCTQLRVSLPGKVSGSLCPASNRTVATQCCLMPTMPSMDVCSWNVDSHRQSPPGYESISERMGCSPTKADKVDILSFLQKLKESLRHSVNTDSLE
ncbi:uncharacterized protein itprid1 [Tautogolabrus adspersus]